MTLLEVGFCLNQLKVSYHQTWCPKNMSWLCESHMHSSGPPHRSLNIKLHGKNTYKRRKTYLSVWVRSSKSYKNNRKQSIQRMDWKKISLLSWLFTSTILTPLGPVCLLPSAITNGDGTAGKIWAKLCALSHGHNSDTKTKKIFHFTSIVWHFTALHVRRHGTNERKTVGLREFHWR